VIVMPNVLYRVSRHAASAVLLIAVLAPIMLAPCQAPAGALDFLAAHQVSVQFAAQDGKPMADAEVRVYAPGQPAQPARTGRTDKDGKFEFPADRDGLWMAEAHSPTEIARATVRVGKLDEEQGGLSPFLVIGVLGVLLVIAVWYRFLRARGRRRGG
jgi:Domain of unknown function (DUF4198)